MPILQCSDLIKTYFQGDTPINAINRAFIKVMRGEFISIIGQSGSGKSTLLHILSGLDRPGAGKVYIDGKDIFAMNDREFSKFRNKNLGFIFQSFNLLPTLTAKENILMPQLIAGQTPSKQYFDELVEMLGIADRIHHLPSELSGGQQQRVAVARALINKPKIVFADEPTGNLDAKSAEELVSLLLKSRELYNQTLIMVTHDSNLAAKADRVMRMTNGILEPITKEQIF
ncbi:MAG: ABC transporter ATP-binding protein [Clostridia bacterium]|nr:ABC transporter ATP-binding protein [Clostridia bacterium]MBQ4574623.1 ABC transporter ATP-binding protein [Clostridia bacterium]